MLQISCFFSFDGFFFSFQGFLASGFHLSWFSLSSWGKFRAHISSVRSSSKNFFMAAPFEAPYWTQFSCLMRQALLFFFSISVVLHLFDCILFLASVIPPNSPFRTLYWSSKIALLTTSSYSFTYIWRLCSIYSTDAIMGQQSSCFVVLSFYFALCNQYETDNIVRLPGKPGIPFRAEASRRPLETTQSPIAAILG